MSTAPTSPDPDLPLAGIVVIDFSQFLSGPSASLRLADLGARVIKIERPGTGDICRTLYVSDVRIDGESTVFHAINRNKEGYMADMKKPADAARLWRLIDHADVVMHNFRPGVIERLGFDYASVRARNPRVVYGAISGYGTEGPWRDKPGQDLLVQSLSGLTGYSGNADDGPVPMGLSVVDIFTGAQLVQGLVACLLRRETTGKGGLVEVSMLESILDFQFEPLTLYWQDGGEKITRTRTNGAHPHLGAPYGVYPTKDGHLALAMGSVVQIGELIGCAPLTAYSEARFWFTQRDEIKTALAAHLATNTTAHWLSLLEPADIWCAEILNYRQLIPHEGFTCLDMVQTFTTAQGREMKTTRCPIRLDDRVLTCPRGAPDIGQHNAAIDAEFNLPAQRPADELARDGRPVSARDKLTASP